MRVLILSLMMLLLLGGVAQADEGVLSTKGSMINLVGYCPETKLLYTSSNVAPDPCSDLQCVLQAFDPWTLKEVSSFSVWGNVSDIFPVDNGQNLIVVMDNLSCADFINAFQSISYEINVKTKLQKIESSSGNVVNEIKYDLSVAGAIAFDHDDYIAFFGFDIAGKEVNQKINKTDFSACPLSYFENVFNEAARSKDGAKLYLPYADYEEKGKNKLHNFSELKIYEYKTASAISTTGDSDNLDDSLFKNCEIGSIKLDSVIVDIESIENSKLYIIDWNYEIKSTVIKVLDTSNDNVSDCMTINIPFNIDDIDKTNGLLLGSVLSSNKSGIGAYGAAESENKTENEIIIINLNDKSYKVVNMPAEYEKNDWYSLAMVSKQGLVRLFWNDDLEKINYFDVNLNEKTR